jgi:uncharacterized lipoprotein YmbA
MKALNYAGAMLVAAALAACSTGPKVDAYYAEVRKAAGNISDSTEAASVEGVTVTAPEDSEAVSM